MATNRKLGKTTQTSKALENDSKVEKTSQDKIIITVSREYGSGGRYVAKILAEKLVGKKEVLELLYEFRYYNLIPITSEELLKDNEELKEDIDKKIQIAVEKLLIICGMIIEWVAGTDNAGINCDG